MYVTYENSQQCITSYRDVEQHPRIPFIPPPELDNDIDKTFPGANGGLVSDGISIECGGIDSSILKSTPVASDFRPTRLIRTSDMTVVPGSEAKNGYCALSYPWEWSGDIETVETNNDEAKNNSFDSPITLQQRVIDRRRHIHIEEPAGPFTNLMFGMAHREDVEQTVADVMDSYTRRSEKPEMGGNPTTMRYVTFIEIIKQLCWMFEINYIWYDQLCILQSNHQDKQNEIRQMHKIYGNAQFTMVMIPEMHFGSNTSAKIDQARTPTQVGIQECIKQIATSKWAQRTWTFEEAVLSKRLLFVGRNVHLWSDTLVSTTHPWQVLPLLKTNEKENDTETVNIGEKEDDDTTKTTETYDLHDESHVRFVQNLCTITPETISASSALWHIHRGENTQDHDKIFALANIFPRLMNDIADFSYDQPLLPLMSQFYNNLIQHDLSVLCFGRAATSVHYGMDRTVRNIGVTSWTGVNGSHMVQTPSRPKAPTTSFGRYFVTEEGYLSIYSTSLTVSVDEVTRRPHTDSMFTYLIKGAGPACSVKATMDYDSYTQVVSSGLAPTHWLSSWEYSESTLGLGELSLSTTKAPDSNSTATTWFSLVGHIGSHKRCTVLIDVAFDIGMDGFQAYPVITQLGRYRSAIGVCIARNLQLLYDSEQLDMDEFTIR